MRQQPGPSSAAEWRASTLGLAPLSLASATTILAECTRHTGVAVYPLPQGDPLLSGALALLDREANCIWYDASLPQHRRHLILAHEFAHIALHTGNLRPDALYQRQYPEAILEDELLGYSPAQRRERDADHFAADLLLPLTALAHAYFERQWGVTRIAGETQFDQWFVMDRLIQLISIPVAGHENDNEGAPVQPLSSALSSLDASQAAAARTSHNRVLVSAGPGTGKTKTLVARFESLVSEQKVSADQITILTFSRSAASELWERAGSILSPERASPWIGTIHAFAYELLRRFSREAGLRGHWQVISSRQAEQLMDRRFTSLSKTGNPLPCLPIGHLLQIVSQLKEQRIDTNRLSLILDSQPSLDAGQTSESLREYGNFYAEYQSALAKANRLDFGDLLTVASKLLESNPDVLEVARQSCRHLLIDEFQDLTPSSLRLIELMAGASERGDMTIAPPVLWAVGDRLQSIYRFQSGSAASSMTEFAETFSSAATLALGCNYRSSTTIVSLLSDVAAKLTAAAAAPQARWRSANTGGEPALKSQSQDIAIARADSPEAEFDGIAAEILRLQNTGIALSQQAVLCRTNAECAAIARELSLRGIHIPESLSWLKATSVKRLMHTLESAARMNSAAERIESSWISGSEAPISDSPSAFLQRLVFDTGERIRTLWNARSTSPAAAHELQSVGELLHEASQWERQEEIPQSIATTATPARLTSFAQYVRGLHREDLRRRPDSQSGGSGVRILTVHAAKGLEFDAVYLPNMVDGAFPRRSHKTDTRVTTLLSQTSSAGATDIDEESCLFFVAISRARSHLLLSYSERAHSRQATKPSPFLRLLQSTPSAKQIKSLRWHSTARQPSPLNPSIHPSQADIAAADELTMAQVSLYEACPRQYRYEMQASKSALSDNPALETNRQASGSSSVVSLPPKSLINAEMELRQRAGIAAEINMRYAGSHPSNPHKTGWISRLLATLRIQPLEVSTTIQLDLDVNPVLARKIRASSGIAAGAFPAQPDSPERCSECPFCYVCPD